MNPHLFPCKHLPGFLVQPLTTALLSQGHLHILILVAKHHNIIEGKAQTLYPLGGGWFNSDPLLSLIRDRLLYPPSLDQGGHGWWKYPSPTS